MSQNQFRGPASGVLRAIIETSAALLDQALFAGTSLLVNVILARWLPVSDYGEFALAYSQFLIIEGIHRTIIVHPILIFGTGESQDRFRSYLASIICIHFTLSLGFAAVLVVVALVFYGIGMDDLGRLLVAIALGGPFMLLMWMLRRAFYAVSAPYLAALGGLVYLILSLGMLIAARHFGLLTVSGTFVILAIAAAIVSAIMVGLLKPDWKSRVRGYREILIRHWTYGRWAAPATLLQWVPMNAYFSFLSLFHGLHTAGVLKASVNMVQPMFHSFYAGALLLIPRFARSLSSGDREGFRREIFGALTLSFGACALFFALLTTVGNPLMIWLYGEQYVVSAPVLAILGLCPFFVALDVVLGAALRAANRSSRIFWAHALGAVVTLVVGTPFTWYLGLEGGVVGFAFSLFAIGIAVVRGYFYERRSLFER